MTLTHHVGTGYDAVHVPDRTLVIYQPSGLQVNAGINVEFDCQPYVTINTEEVGDEHHYDDGSGTPEYPAKCPKIAVHLHDNTIYDDEGAGPIQQADTPKTDRFAAMELALEVIRDSVNNPRDALGDVHAVVCDQLQQLGMLS